MTAASVMLAVAAPAKINLFLHVTGRRADGYHTLESLFALVDLADTITLRRRDDGAIVRSNDVAGVAAIDDLALRAAQALQLESGTRFGVELAVDKRIPIGGGLGGGSSDAASTLLALNRLWGLHWPRERLQQLALPLGADVPFFIGGQNAFVGGIGEQLTPLPAGSLVDRRFVVVKPAEAVATAAIFGSPLLARNTDAAIVMSFLEDARLAAKLWNGYGRNDLQPPAEASCPAVTQVAAWLQTRFGNSRMSGSGSAVFARMNALNESNVLNGTAAQPEFAADSLPPGWVGRMCRSLDHHPLVGWAD